MILVSHDKPSESAEPAESTFDDISSLVAIPESVVLSVDVSMVLPMRRKKVDTSLSETFSVRVAIVCLVTDHSLRSGLWSPWPFFRHSDVCHDVLEELDLRGRGRVGMASQRNTLAIDHHQALRSLAPLGFPDCRAPFFAGMKVASTKLSSQSRTPSSSSSERKARHISLRTPDSCQSLRRRQHVDGSGYWLGRSRHLAPVLRIQRIPSKQARSSAGGRPPFGLGGGRGIKGLIFSHCSSVNIGSRALIGSPPTRVIREINRKYKGLFVTRLHAVRPKYGFCNHF
jgi:hypothetical protein